MTTRDALFRRTLSRLGFGDYSFDTDPDTRALLRDALDGMMAEWAVQDVVLSYVPSEDDDNDAADTGLPDWCVEAVSANLACRVAADVSKVPGPGLIAAAKRGYDLCVTQQTQAPRMKAAYPTVRGGGYWTGYRRWP